MAQTQSSKGEHQNVARAAMVLDALSEMSGQGLRQTDLVERTGLGVAVISRLLSGLTIHGFVDHDAQNNRYFLGFRLLSWGAVTTERYGLAPFIEESLDEICDATGDTVFFSLLSGRRSVCVDRREGSFPIRTLTLNIGDRRPLGVGAGSLAILAAQPRDVIDSILADDEDDRAPFRIETNWLRRNVEKAQTNGFAINDGQIVEGMFAVSVPICRSDGQAIGSLSIAAIEQRLSGTRLEQAVKCLKSEIQKIEARAMKILDTPFAKRYSKPRS